jgi:DNA-binding NtrC family response regulator
MSRKQEPPTTRSLPVARGRPRLVVITGATLATHALPLAGAVTIGRDPACEIQIDDPSISRKHARIDLGTAITVEDLGSSNGCELRGKRIAAHQRVPLAYDEVLTVGAVGIVIQQHAPVTRQRALWGHGYFELRLSEECTRAQRAGSTFGLLRIRGRDTEHTVSALSAAVREIDVIGTYAPGEWEVIVVDAAREAIERVATAVRRLDGVTVGVAVFPDDGHDAWTLASAVRAQLGHVDAEPDAPRLSAIGPMKPLVELIAKVALGDISVLIQGETGTGKEVVAEELHRRSRRAKHPLLKLNCAALPEHLLESELFGHERGAFTGAVVAKPGLLEEADGGSVFLDEIGEMPAGTQAKLLRVLEQREIQRVGALRSKKIDVRFIAATHRDLDAAIAAGTFREDLYFRLAAVTLGVPPLRERTAEIDELIARFSERTARGLGRATPRIAPATRALLHAYHWPGNIRELRNAIERATLLCDSTIEPEHLPQERMREPVVVAVAAVAGGLEEVRAASEALERKAIEGALATAGGNQTVAARALGISRRTLTNKLDHFGFERPRKRT